MEIKEIFQKVTQAEIIAELKLGRLLVMPTIDIYKNQLNIVGHEVFDKSKRKDKVVKVDKTDTNEYLNVTPVTEDDAATRLEPVERIGLALQKLIVKRAVAFIFGSDVDLKCETTTDQEKQALNAIKRILIETKSRTLNRTLAKHIFSATEAAEVWYAVEEKNRKYGFDSSIKLRSAVFSPLQGDELYPYFDETGDMTAFSRGYIITVNSVKYEYFETYTAEFHVRWHKTNDGWAIMDGFPIINTLGKIPVIYGCQPEVEWADVQGLINRLEKLLSNFADTNDYHASPKIFVTGEVSGFSKKGEQGAIIEGDENATAQYLAWQNAPESVKLEIETLLRMIYTISQTPDLSWESVKGLGAISGVALKMLFIDAHLKVMDKREIFDDFLQRRLSVIKSFLSEMNKQLGTTCETLNIEADIQPYMVEDDKAKVDLLLSANGSKPIVSQKTAVAMLGWSAKPDDELTLIQSEESTAMSFIQGQPTN